MLTIRLCISLILESRTIDLYLSPEQINYWYIGLAEEVKKKNPKAYTLSVGRFFWKKLKMMGTYLINQRFGITKRKGKAFKSFVRALVALKIAETPGLPSK